MPAPKEEKEVEFKASRFRSISMQEFDLMNESEALSSMEVELQEVFVASARAANQQHHAESQKQGQGDSQNEESKFNQEWNMNWNQHDDKPTTFDFLAYPEPAASLGDG